jgi:hypothetical protein
MVVMVFLIWTGLVEAGMLVVEIGSDGFTSSEQAWWRQACWWMSLVVMVFPIWTGLVEAGMLVVEI